MPFKFVHTADWQLGKPFGRLDPEKAAVLRRARLDAIDRIASAAREAGARHILVAGDVFDAETLPDRVLRQALSRLAGSNDLTWHLLPGNHDPARSGGIWNLLHRLGMPANVRPHLVPAAVEIAPGVHLLPAPLAAKATANDPTSWMTSAATPAGAIRIGMAHGSVAGFGSLGEANVPIDPGRAARAGLDYLALGDWHGLKQVGPATWYAGTPEPDGYLDNSPGQALVVELEGPRQRALATAVATATFHWRAASIQVDDIAHAARLDALLSAAKGSPSTTLVSLALSGRVTHAAAAALELRLRQIEAALFDLRIDRSGLGIVVETSDIEALGPGSLGTVARRIEAAAASQDPELARTAGRALELLLELEAGSVAEDAA